MMRLHGPRQSKAVSRVRSPHRFRPHFQAFVHPSTTTSYHIGMHTFFLKLRMVNVHFFTNSHANVSEDKRLVQSVKKDRFFHFIITHVSPWSS